MLSLGYMVYQVHSLSRECDSIQRWRDGDATDGHTIQGDRILNCPPMWGFPERMGRFRAAFGA